MSNYNIKTMTAEEIVCYFLSSYDEKDRSKTEDIFLGMLSNFKKSFVLDNIDFREILEWVCDKFPDLSTVQSEDDYKKHEINGYKINNNDIYRSIENTFGDGLRGLVQNMVKIEEKEQKGLIQLVPDENGNIQIDLFDLFFAKSLSKYLTNFENGQ